jgi:hypothetical protein
MMKEEAKILTRSGEMYGEREYKRGIEKILTYGAEPFLRIVQPLKNFQEFYGTRRFIAVFTGSLHWSLS